MIPVWQDGFMLPEPYGYPAWGIISGNGRLLKKNSCINDTRALTFRVHNDWIQVNFGNVGTGGKQGGCPANDINQRLTIRGFFPLAP